MDHLRNLGNHFSISLPTDEEGYIGRECPNVNCKGYFKIVNGTGLSDVTDCHCPYCGHITDQSEFHTPDQIEYAKSVAMQKISDALLKDLKKKEFDIKPRGPFGIGISMKVESKKTHPIHWYREKVLETHIQCENCTLKYAVFGVFAFCPDCGQHNSLQILKMNLEVVGKMLNMAETADAALKIRLVENALEDTISTFDGFGRELCRIHNKKSSDPAKAEKITFQNLEGARHNLTVLFGLDIAAGFTPDEWKEAVRGFQKRHLIAHKMGVVDAEYIQKTGDTQNTIGRKVNISENEIRKIVQFVGNLSRNIFEYLK
jgi:hypothetical protein